MLKVDEIIFNDLHPLIHGALISRIIVSSDNKYFATVSAYQESRKIECSSNKFKKLADVFVEKLNQITKPVKWISLEEYKTKFINLGLRLTGKEKAILLIENNLGLTKEDFFKRLYAKFFNCKWIDYVDLNEEKKQFIRGFCELRGSIDTQRKYVSLDYFYDDQFELSKARLLTDFLSVPYYILNLNFRELQHQYISGINKRHTQLRLQLNWYAKNIGLLSDYKTEIVEMVLDNKSMSIGKINYFDVADIKPQGSELFITRINHFINNVYNKTLDKDVIARLRNDFSFDLYTEQKNIRNKHIVELIRYINPDVCVGCFDRYKIQDRSFIHRRTYRYYFEIHHNIALGNKIDLDHEDNLVKLCPTCHATLKRGVGLEQDQKYIIEQILKNSPNVQEFAENFFNTKDKTTLIEQIYQHLK